MKPLVSLLLVMGLFLPVIYIFLIMAQPISSGGEETAASMETEKQDAEPEDEFSNFQTSSVQTTRWIGPFLFLRDWVSFGHHVWIGRIGLVTSAIMGALLCYAVFVGGKSTG